MIYTCVSVLLSELSEILHEDPPPPPLLLHLLIDFECLVMISHSDKSSGNYLIRIQFGISVQIQ